jgi:regulatory protein
MVGAASDRTRSLKARAIQWLAQREHSRVELRRKLLPHALAEAAPHQPQVMPDPQRHTALADSQPEPAAAESLQQLPQRSAQALSDRAAALAQVDDLLDWLEARHYLSAQRFVESRVHARASRFGNLRIRQELAQHSVALSPGAAASLKDTELDRARAVWERKFQHAGSSSAERARQARFLAGRGFSGEVVQRVLREAARRVLPDSAAPPGDGPDDD